MREKDFLPGENGMAKSTGNGEGVVFLKALCKHDFWLLFGLFFFFLPFLTTPNRVDLPKLRIDALVGPIPLAY